MLVLFGAVIFLVYKFNEIDFSKTYIHYAYLLIFSVILMSVNWLMESLKWRLLLKQVYSISLLESIKSVFFGITTSIFTPNRVGEVVGRLYYVPKQKIIQAGASELAGSIMQSVVSIMFGLIAIMFNADLLDKVNFNFNYLFAVLVLIIFLSVVFIVNKLWHSKFIEFKNSLFNLSFNVILKAFIYSVLRYVIFIAQFYFISHSFGYNISFFNSVQSLAVFYLAMMFLPVFTIFEPGVRISVALLVFPFFNIPDDISLISISALWLINIGIPAIIGAVLLFINGKRQNYPQNNT